MPKKVLSKEENLDGIESAKSNEPIDVVHETKLLLNIAIPTVVVQFSAYFLFPQTASAVGRNLGTEELAGFSLASLTGNMMCLSIIVGALSALDTLMPRAFGLGRYQEVGKLAIRGFIITALVMCIPVIPLLTSVKRIFDALGQDEIVSARSSDWLRIYLIGVPFVLLYRVTQRFLACQQLVMPIAYAGLIGCFVVHPIVLRYGIRFMGFHGSAVAIVMTQFVQAFLVVLYLRLRPVYHPETWSGLSVSTIKGAFEPGPMLHFFKLGMGGVVSLSEWWFWETICFLAGHMGVIPLCIHTIAYNLIPVLFMIPLGFGIGMSVRMGHVLAYDVHRAKVIAATCMAVSTLAALLIATLVFHLREPIVGLFSNDEQVMMGCLEIWPKMCIFIVIQCVFGINSAILRVLGMQWRTAAIICSVLWVVALPIIVYTSIVRGGGVNAIWSCVPISYTVLNIFLIHAFVTADWNAISGEARRRRSSVAESIATETTLLLDGIEAPN